MLQRLKTNSGALQLTEDKKVWATKEVTTGTGTKSLTEFIDKVNTLTSVDI